MDDPGGFSFVIPVINAGQEQTVYFVLSLNATP
jgi:hypothetical protein